MDNAIRCYYWRNNMNINMKMESSLPEREGQVPITGGVPPLAMTPEGMEETNEYSVTIDGQEITFQDDAALSDEEAANIAQMIYERHKREMSAKETPQTKKTGEGPTQETSAGQRTEYEDLIRKGRGKRTGDENARLKELGGLLGSNRQGEKPKDKPKPQTKGGNQWRDEKKESSDRHRSVKHRGEGSNSGAAKPENVNSGLRGEILVLRNLERELTKEGDSTKKEALLKKITIQKGRVYGLSKNTPLSVPQSPKPNL